MSIDVTTFKPGSELWLTSEKPDGPRVRVRVQGTDLEIGLSGSDRDSRWRDSRWRDEPWPSWGQATTEDKVQAMKELAEKLAAHVDRAAVLELLQNSGQSLRIGIWKYIKDFEGGP